MKAALYQWLANALLVVDEHRSHLGHWSLNHGCIKLFCESSSFLFLVPLTPDSLVVTSHSSSMLAVQWKAPAGQRDNYMVSVSEEGAAAIQSHRHVGKTSTNITLEGLTPGTCYLIAVWALAGPYTSASRNITSCTG